MIIGGIAAIVHGVPRATFDLDILIDATLENAQNLLEALLEAGIGTASLTTAEEIIAHEVTIFRDRVRIDVQTSTPGLDFEKAWAERQEMNYAGQVFNVVSRQHLIDSKCAAGQDKDLADIRILELEIDEE